MKVIVNNLAVNYTDRGKGKPFLLLHGWGDNLHTFDLLVKELGSEYRFIALDLPGFGESEIPKETWEIADYIDFTAAFCNKIEVTPEVIVGHSFGGRVAIKGIANGGLKADRLVLIGSAGIAKSKSIKNIFVTFGAKIFKYVTFIPPLYFYRDQLRRKMYQMIGSDYLEAGAMKDIFLATIHEDLQQYAAKIKVPTLIIWGENDSATPLADGMKLNSLIKDSKLEIISGATHFVHQEQPKRVVEIIKDFLK